MKLLKKLSSKVSKKVLVTARYQCVLGSVVGLLASGHVTALELGQLHIYSPVNKPLDAEIQLLELDGVSPEILNIRLADSADVAIEGLPLQHPLAGLKYYVAADSADTATIRLISRRPVNDPYISFLLEVTWPEGRMLREYTALLPVPEQAKQVVQAAPVLEQAKPETLKPKASPKPAVSTPASEPQLSSYIVKQVEQPAVTPKIKRQPLPKPTQSIESLVDETSGVQVAAKETLWNVSLRSKPDGVTNQQMMLAFFRSNPQAFYQGRFDGLQKGAYLIKPALDEILHTSPKDAYRIVKALLSGADPKEVMSGDNIIASAKAAPKAVRQEEVAVTQPKVSAADGVSVIVGPQETLWDIVVAQRPGPWVNTRQMMVAVLKKNPHAFEQGNINRMLRGVSLTMPTQDEINELTPEQASFEVRRQIALWREQEGLPPQAVVEDFSAPKQVLSVESADLTESKPLKPKTELSSVAVDVTTPNMQTATKLDTKRQKVQVQKQDTLWTIANAYKPNDESTTGQMIKAIIRLNPQAFVQGSMHDMVEGAVLTMPNASDLASF